MEFLSQTLPVAAVSFESLISIVYFLLAFSLVIFVHELGHFAVAKFCGIKVLRFSIGMPPRLIGIQIGETDYCIGALPLGGYVKMLGGETGDETEDGAGSDPDDPRAFVNKSVGARAAVLSAGVIMNLIFAFVLFIAIFQHGINSPSKEVGRVLADGAAGRLADKEGPEASLMPGDLILSVNGTEVADFLEIQVETALSDSDKPLEIVVQRDGRPRTLVIPRGAAGKAAALAAGRPLIGFEGARSLTIPAGAPAELPVGWTITGVKGDGGFEDVDTHVALEERFARNAGRPVTLRLKAPEGDAVREAVVTPRLTVPDDKARTLLGGLLPRIKIRRVEPGSPADAGGLRAGDVVLSVDGNELPGRDGLVKAIHAAGERPITFRVLRGERTETVVVAPQSRRWERRPTVGIEYGDFDWDHFVVGEVLTTYLINAAALQGLRSGGLPEALSDRLALLQGKPFPDRAAFEAALDAHLTAAGAELVCLAGFMRVLTAAFVARWHDRLLNIHPSLLPAFPGLDTHARALAAGCKVHGATVHFVTPDLDDGPIVAQAVVEVRDDDTPETLAARVLRQEHRIYPEAVALLAAGRLSIDGRRVRRMPG